MDDNAEILKEKAYNLHIQGKFDEAKTLYEIILKDNPNNIPVMFLYAQLLYSIKNYSQAIECFNKIYSVLKTDDIKLNIAMSYYELKEYDIALKELRQIQKTNIEVLKLKANIYTKMHDIDNTISIYKELADTDPSKKDFCYYNISMLYKENNDLSKAFEYALKAYNINKTDLNIILNAAQICELANDVDKLLFFLQEAEKLNNNENILIKIAILLEMKYDFSNAFLYYIKILNIDENNYFALIRTAKILFKIKSYEKAMHYIKRAEKTAPDEYDTIQVYSEYYFHTKEFDKAKEYANKLISKDNKNVKGYEILYDIYYALNDFHSAMEICSQILRIYPKDTDFICRKAVCLSIFNRDKEAVDLLENNKDEDSYVYKKTITFIRLTNQDYESGMEYYNELISPQATELIKTEENNSIYKCDEKLYEYYSKKWNREDLTGKKILIHQGSHGVGDYIMFSRYIPELEKRNCKVIVEVSDNLYDLFKINFKNSTVIRETKNAYTDCDYTASSMDLFYGVNYGFKKILSPEGWLDVPKTDIDNSEITKLFDKNKKNIGIFWQGNKNIMTSRHINLEELVPLFEISNLNFYSLDITDKDEKTTEFFNRYNIVDGGKYIKNALDTAIFLKNLDILITVDSFPANLAGALGVKTYLLLPVNYEWRWLKDEKRTPWYNSITLFRQKLEPDWKNVVQNVKSELIK